MKTYPRLQKLIRRAQWNASLRISDARGWGLTGDEFSELNAYGWAGLLTAVQRGHRGPGYLYRSAVNQMLRDFWRQRHEDALTYAASIDYVRVRSSCTIQNDRTLPDDIANALLKAFMQQRKKGGRRGLEASLQDINIISLLYSGYNNEGIANELNIPVRSVQVYRRRIQARLEAIRSETSCIQTTP